MPFPRNPRQMIRHVFEEFFDVTGGKPYMPAIGILEAETWVADINWVSILYNRPTHKERRWCRYNVSFIEVQQNVEFQASSAGVNIVV